MTENDARQQKGEYHPLPDLIDKVLNGDVEVARSGGWDVEVYEGELEIGVYEEPPETGGSVKVVGRIPLLHPEDGDL